MLAKIENSESIVFILFHNGETRALMQTMESMIESEHNILVIPVGQSAKEDLEKSSSSTLKSSIWIPNFIEQGLAKNHDYGLNFEPEHIHEVVIQCMGCSHAVIGFPSRIQEQITAALPAEIKKIVYFDMGSNETKIEAFSHHANVLLMTTLKAQQDARMSLQHLIHKGIINKAPLVLAARHGDLDTWCKKYKEQNDRKSSIRASLGIYNQDEFALWAGGYGDFSEEDTERVAFQTFIAAWKHHTPDLDLVIRPHPGLYEYSKYEKDKFERIIKFYYIDPLTGIGFSTIEANKMITNLPTVDVVSARPLIVVSVNSTVGVQTKFLACMEQLNMDAVNVFSKGVQPIVGIKVVEAHEWDEVLGNLRSPNPQDYKKILKDLSLPNASTQFILRSYLFEEHAAHLKHYGLFSNSARQKADGLTTIPMPPALKNN